MLDYASEVWIPGQHNGPKVRSNLNFTLTFASLDLMFTFRN